MHLLAILRPNGDFLSTLYQVSSHRVAHQAESEKSNVFNSHVLFSVTRPKGKHRPAIHLEAEDIAVSHAKGPTSLRPETDVLTRGFDPRLSVGSARPAVFRSSTYVFSSPEEAEKAFDVMGGRAQLSPGESVDLVYSRFNHPNAEILEEQILPLEPGHRPRRCSTPAWRRS